MRKYNYVWKVKTTKTLGLCKHTHVCVRRFDVCIGIYRHAYAVKVLETMKDKFSTLKIEVWNESHIV